MNGYASGYAPTPAESAYCAGYVTVVKESSPSVGGSVTGVGSACEGSYFSFLASPASGYSFSSWSVTGDGSLYSSSGASVTVQMGFTVGYVYVDAYFVTSVTTTSSTSSKISTTSTTQTSSTSSKISTTSSSTSTSAPFTVSIFDGPSQSNPLTWSFGETATGGSGVVSSCVWSYGDGSTGTGCSLSHSYTQSGTYTVSLAATDSAGNKASASSTITVSSPTTSTSSSSSMSSSSSSQSTSTSSSSTTVTTGGIGVTCTLDSQAAYSTTTIVTTNPVVAVSCTITSGQSLISSIQLVIIDSVGNKQIFTMTENGSTYTYSYTLPTTGIYIIQANAIESTSTINLFSLVYSPNTVSPPSCILTSCFNPNAQKLQEFSYLLIILGVVLLAFSYKRELGMSATI